MSKNRANTVNPIGSYDEWAIEELRRDREFAFCSLQLALESLNNPDERGGALLSLRAIAEAYGGLGKVAKETGISRESLYRSLSPKGNPTLKTLVAIMNAVGMRLSAKDAAPIKLTANKAPAGAARSRPNRKVKAAA